VTEPGLTFGKAQSLDVNDRCFIFDYATKPQMSCMS